LQKLWFLKTHLNRGIIPKIQAKTLRASPSTPHLYPNLTDKNFFGFSRKNHKKRASQSVFSQEETINRHKQKLKKQEKNYFITIS
jgi:hypothetical protein